MQAVFFLEQRRPRLTYSKHTHTHQKNHTPELEAVETDRTTRAVLTALTLVTYELTGQPAIAACRLLIWVDVQLLFEPIMVL